MNSDSGQTSVWLQEPIEIKKEKWDSEEIVLGDSSDDEVENKQMSKNTITVESKTRALWAYYKKNIPKAASLRGLLPREGDESYNSVVNLPVVKRCCIEHCYFARNRSRINRYNLRNLPATSANTVQFENKNSVEQQTIDSGCLRPQEVKSVNESVDKNNINCKRKRNSLSSSSSSSSSSSEDSPADDSNDRDYCPEDNSSGTDCETGSVRSVESCDSVKEIWKSNAINTSYSHLKNIINDRRKSFPRRALEITSYPAPNKIPSNFVSVHDLLAKIRNMHKLMKAKCEQTDVGKTDKILPPRPKKMICRKEDGLVKMPQHLLTTPTLTKLVSRDKNWRSEFMDDKVQRFGLDDLLLKASELNAQNFTKALGRKLPPGKPNFNAKNGSEIVFTIPKPKRNEAEQSGESNSVADQCGNSNVERICDVPNGEAELGCNPSGPSEQNGIAEKSGDLRGNAEQNSDANSQRQSIKTIKIDNCKAVFESDKSRETERAPVPPKPPEEESPPKRLGIKVKTVENINEEFQDSLGLKAFQDGVDKISSHKPDLEKNGEGSPQFVMPIIQNKVEKQRPAILRNSSYFKKKVINLEKGKTKEVEVGKVEERLDEPSKPPADKSGQDGGRNENVSRGATFGGGFGSYSKMSVDEVDNEIGNLEEGVSENRFTVEKRNIPFILNHNRKSKQAEPGSKPQTKPWPNEASRFSFINVVPYDPVSKPVEQKLSEDEIESPQRDGSEISLIAFSSVLKDILPDKWVVCLDRKYGLQIIKIHMDDLLNPSVQMSVVIARCGKLTVNVRGRQLQKSHQLFSNLREMVTSENKLSLNYVLDIINRLKCLSVCFGCDDPSLRKYWCEDGFVDQHSEFQQVYRSHLCELLVSLGKKRCFACYRMNESLKKRYRKDKMQEKPREDSGKDSLEETETEKNLQSRGIKRNLEDFLEESFSTMKQQIVDEIEKNKKLGEKENAMKAQEEVLSFMGLARKDTLEAPLRKSKRKKNSFYKVQQPLKKKKIDQQELEFLEKYWADINTLFSTSLHFGAYSRMGRGRLREKCRMFQKLLHTWRNIMKSNPEWIGVEVSLPEELPDAESPLNGEPFEKMDGPALRAYIINSVKEVNKIKHKLRTKNSYFKVLYDKFVKRRMKEPTAIYSQEKGKGSSGKSATNTPTASDFTSDDSSRDKEKATDEGNPTASEAVVTSASDRD